MKKYGLKKKRINRLIKPDEVLTHSLLQNFLLVNRPIDSSVFKVKKYEFDVNEVGVWVEEGKDSVLKPLRKQKPG